MPRRPLFCQTCDDLLEQLAKAAEAANLRAAADALDLVMRGDDIAMVADVDPVIDTQRLSKPLMNPFRPPLSLSFSWTCPPNSKRGSFPILKPRR